MRAEVSIDANEEAVDKTPANRENTTDIQPAFVPRVWEPKRMEKLFVYLNGILVNLNQIAWVGDATEESLGLHLSDGKTVVIEGRSAVEGLVELLSRISMVPDGTPLKTALALGKKLPVSEIGQTVPQ